MHGFISQEDNGWFSYYSVNVEDSYRFAICCVIDGLRMDEAKIIVLVEPLLFPVLGVTVSEFLSK